MPDDSQTHGLARVQFITVKAVIKDAQSRILMLKDEKDKWELPGGKIDFGESPREALSREITEELNVGGVTIGALVDAWSFLVDTPELSKQYIVLVYACDLPKESISISAEHTEASWFTIDEITKLNLREGYIASIAAVLKAAR